MTSRSERIHIGIFGRVNAGKSSFINKITGQETSIISEIKGTTTDPIYKSMEIHDLGPVVFIDTAGVCDDTDLSEKRLEKTKSVILKSDIFIYLLTEDDDLAFLEEIKTTKKPIIFVVSKIDTIEGKRARDKFKHLSPLEFSINSKNARDIIFSKLKELVNVTKNDITKNLVKKDDVVLLVMPQDKEAPKDRLIKPQVMTIRELIDKNCIGICVNLEEYETAIEKLKLPPDLIICDSQVFKQVYEKKPKESKLTSFSVLFSALKGDIDYYLESVKILDDKPKKILIAEACTHPPITEDIGTVKIPNLIRKNNPNVEFDFCRGDDFSDIEKYDLIISCGSCMFNRTHVKNRVELAKEKKIPMTNYGITIAYLNGILDKIDLV